MMKTKLTYFQTKRGKSLFGTLSTLVIVAIIIFLFYINSFPNLPASPFIIVGFIVSVGLGYIHDDVLCISEDQHKWLLENSKRETISTINYSLSDFYPEQQYKLTNDNEFKKQPNHKNLQFELEHKADNIIFKTGATEFSASLTLSDIADEDVKEVLDDEFDEETAEQTLTYNLPVSAKTFQEWSKLDRPFSVKSFLEYAEDKK